MQTHPHDVRAWITQKIRQIEGLEDKIMIDMVCRRLNDASLDYLGLEASLKILMKPADASGFAAELWSLLGLTHDCVTSPETRSRGGAEKGTREFRECDARVHAGCSNESHKLISHEPYDSLRNPSARMGTWYMAAYKSAKCAVLGNAIDQIHFPGPLSDPQERSLLPTPPFYLHMGSHRAQISTAADA